MMALEAFDLLRKLHDDVMGWLKYAEAKNAALAAIAAGALYASVNLAANHGNGVVNVGAGMAAAFFLLSLALAIVSFLPVNNPAFTALFQGRRPAAASVNIFFFGDLGGLDANDLLRRLTPTAADAPDESGDRRLLDLASQVIVTSRIAQRKLAFFEAGTWLFVSGLLTPIAAFLLFWISGGPQRLGARAE